MVTKSKKQSSVQQSSVHIWIRYVLALLFTGLIIGVIVQNKQQFLDSLQIIRHVRPELLLLEAVVYFFAVLFAAICYWVLTLTPVNFRHLLWLEWAASGVNRLLPAGTGNIGMHALYLIKHRHTAAQSAAVVSVNNALGVSMHVCALGLLAVFYPTLFIGLHIRIPVHIAWVIGVVAVAVALSLLTPRIQRYVAQFLTHFSTSLLTYKKFPHKLVLGALSSFSVTLCNTLLFMIALHAVGIAISPLEAFAIYSVGVLFGSVSPTPGGLGGVEAGLVAGLIAKGVSPVHALAAALTFRLATYWLPLVLGPIALLHIRRRKLL